MIEKIPVEFLEIGIGCAIGILGTLAIIFRIIIKRRDERERREKLLKRIKPTSSSFPW